MPAFPVEQGDEVRIAWAKGIKWLRNGEETVPFRVQDNKGRCLDKGGSWILGKGFWVSYLMVKCAAVIDSWARIKLGGLELFGL